MSRTPAGRDQHGDWVRGPLRPHMTVSLDGPRVNFDAVPAIEGGNPGSNRYQEESG